MYFIYSGSWLSKWWVLKYAEKSFRLKIILSPISWKIWPIHFFH